MIKVVKRIDDDGIEFADGTTIIDDHEQDCCESVYADWGYLKDEVAIGESLNIGAFEKVADKGFRIGGYFVPCYDYQNGYYSNNLTLTFTFPNGNVVREDITECTNADYSY